MILGADYFVKGFYCLSLLKAPKLPLVHRGVSLVYHICIKPIVYTLDTGLLYRSCLAL
jgi:hypothetical protein